MRVLVTGATGVLGRTLLPQLAEAGHETFGMARSPESLLKVDRLGARAVRADILEASAVRRVVEEVQPEVIVNLATSIPLRLRVQLKDWEQNDRIRTEGTRNLLEAARELSLRLFVQESVGYVCRSQGDGWIDETSPRSDHPFLRGALSMEDLVDADPAPSVLLRFGALVAADSWHIQQSITALRRGMLPVIGDGEAFISQIHVEDAAQAMLRTLAAPAAAAEGRLFHVVDDEPARMRDVWPAAARLLKAPVPRHVPPFIARLAVGQITLEVLTASYRMSNAKLKQALGFAPRYPTYRESWEEIARQTAGKEFKPSDDLTTGS